MTEPNEAAVPANDGARQQSGSIHGERSSSDSDAKPTPSPRWYQDPSKVVGVLGFILALGTLGERMWVRHSEEVDRQLQQLRQATSDLADVQVELLELLASAPKNLYSLSVAKNTKRQMIIQTATALLRSAELKAQTSAQILATLANELGIDGRYEDARALYEDALKAPGMDATTEPYILRSIGQLYRIPNTKFADVQKSRDYYRRALALIAKRTDDTGHLAWAETILNEASIEVVVGDATRAKELVAKARERLALVKATTPSKLELERIAAAYERGEQFISTQTPELVAPSPPSRSSSTVATALTTDATGVSLELWAPIPNMLPGAEMDVLIDGQQVGQLSNLNEHRSLTVPLAPGFHRFSLANMKTYVTDPAGGSKLVASGMACTGVFERPAATTVLKVNVNMGPNGMLCALQ